MGEATVTAAGDDLTEAMRDVVDPELGINVVDLGLVYGITEVLAERGINITNLDAKTARVGEKLEYIQLFEVDIPKAQDYGRIQEKLRARGKEMGVAVDLQHRGLFRAMNQI